MSGWKVHFSNRELERERRLGSQEEEQANAKMEERREREGEFYYCLSSIVREYKVNI